jgi:muramoyltetrapeptide carboxypeptidase
VDVRAPLSPPSLAPGSLIAVVAPASPFDRAELFRGLAWLRTRYRLRLTSSILARTGYLAGDDARRSAELSRAMQDPEVEGIVFARGGYGAMRILDALPWEAFAARPKWLVGFSDVTALHVEANARNICTVHAPNVTGLGRSISASERLSLIAALEGLPRAPWAGLEVIHRGVPDGSARGSAAVTGLLVGGNLALLEAMAAAGRLVVPPGALLVIEDVTERPYRIDRMLTSLLLGGHLARAAGIVFGGFTQCEPGADAVQVETVLSDRTAQLGIPVVSGAPFGHGAPNHAFVLGARATLDGATLSF